MFYSQCLVSRKGPLGSIWVAAYFFKKLKKTQIKDIHIPSSVDQILQKELDALTYRVLAYLLVGVVRIYSKKVNFLFDDCNRALIGVKEFVVKEKNRENKVVPLAASTERFSIDLPQKFELDAFELEIVEDFHGGNVKPQEDITLKGGQEPESMDQFSTEKFDMEEDLTFTFDKAFVANHDQTNHESFVHDMDIDIENVRETTVKASVKVVDAELMDSNGSSRDHQSASRQRADPESDEMIVEPQEDIRRAQEVETVRDHVSSKDNLHKGRHSENSESEKTSVETTYRSLPSDVTTNNKVKKIPKMSTLEEPEPGSVSEFRDLPEGVEKYRGHRDEGITDFEMFHGSHKELSETSEVNHGVEKGFLSDLTFSEVGNKGFNMTDTPSAVTPKAPLQLRISEGETSPLFSVIPTPATKESSRGVSRKRKCVIDDEVIIPNKVMKRMIEDSSKLVSKRRKLPHDADYPERRIKRVVDPATNCVFPLFSYGPLDLQLLFLQSIKLKEPKTVETPEAGKTAGRKKISSIETIKTPHAAAFGKLKGTVPKTVGSTTEFSAIATEIAHQTEFAPETPVVFEQVQIAPETPVSKIYFNDHETCNKETRPASSFTSFKEYADKDLDSILMNDEVNAYATENSQQETWSVRTRNVAKFLKKKFLEQRGRKEEEENVSLLELCKGRTQKENARLFYETLVLKTKGYLEVKQDHPYSDIKLTWFTRQQEAC